MNNVRIQTAGLPLNSEDANRMAKLVPLNLRPPNLYLTTVRNTRLWSFLVDNNVIGPTGLMNLQSFSPKLREIIILRTCVANGCDYEFNLHVQTISERMGLSLQQINAIRFENLLPNDWLKEELVVMELVDALVKRRVVSDSEFGRARELFTDEALIEIANLVGLYTGVAMIAALVQPAFDIYKFSKPVFSTPDGAIK